MQKNTIFFLLLILVIYSGCGKTTTEPGAPFRGVLTGTIFDPVNNIPVSGATVSFFSGQNTAVTDANGNFEIDSLPIGWDKLTATKTGYITLTDSVIIVTDHLTTYSGFMSPAFKGWITGWQPVTSGTSAILTNASYATKSVVYVCGFSGTLLRSVDGGVTWNAIGTPTAENLYVVHFTDLNTGIIMGNTGSIFRTTDAGANWTPTDGKGYAFRNVSFSDALHGTAVGGANSGANAIVFRTNDCGVTWTDQSSNFSGLLSSPLYGVAFINATTGFVGGTDGQVYKTTDGGLTWSKVFSANAWVRSMFPTDISGATLVGAGGMIRHTTDAGFTWVSQGSSPSVYFNGISYSDPRHGTVAGDNGTIMHTRTGGTTWINQSLNGFSGKFYGSAFTDSVHGVIVGENGAILTPVTQ